MASGKAHFWFDGVEEVVTSGHMVLYQPKEIQKYVYYVEDHPEVFWIHFTGYDVKNILNYHGIPLDKHVFLQRHTAGLQNAVPKDHPGTATM